ncbi:MAG TPA: GNAT family N-acetyltransferase [Ruminiclostridium sp.]
MNFKLVKPLPEMEQAYLSYICEWEDLKDEIVPYASRHEGVSYNDILDRWRRDATDISYEKGFVPATLYFLVDESNKIYGALHIRHELNEYLHNYGGHIGYGIRFSERRKGYATEMLALALPIAKGFGIDKALVTCDRNNIASAKTIISNGGVLENEVKDGEKITQRYWISL